MLVVFPVGFDEKFIVRALMRKREEVDGLEHGDKLVAILPEGYEREQRTINALEAIESIASPIVGKGNIVRLEVSLNGEEIVLAIKRGIEDHLTRDRIVLAVLSGGMRPLLVGTMLALLGLKEARVIVESDFENLSGHISLELGPFLAPQSRRWKLILCGLGEGKSVRTIAEELGVSPATISNELKKMSEYHLIKDERPDGRAPRYHITRAGKTYLRLMGGECDET
ncbi:CRISPR locus-related DNA-binding protein [Thermococcus sp. M36]|uniref:CRISPR-associated CARF protein Csa3 n=1 Tax=Thermococcus sp. M36 TaxID=1638261 RepID=UPI00143B0534|nr:CRISPR-associated CARF protein Csa3 [Thermococcus sp. M36]NJE06344.1 CRISPR locus-related DNA-binding protein [Thermococcus sp. M36]